MLFSSARPQLSTTTPSLEEIEAYKEALQNYPQQPRLCNVSSIKLPKMGLKEVLWEKAVSFAYAINSKEWGDNARSYWAYEATNVWLLLLQQNNTNPNGIAVLYEGSGYDCAEGSSRRLREDHYLVVAIGENLTTKELVFEEFQRVIKQPGADVKEGYVLKLDSLSTYNTPGLFKFIPYLGSMD